MRTTDLTRMVVPPTARDDGSDDDVEDPSHRWLAWAQRMAVDSSDYSPDNGG